MGASGSTVATIPEETVGASSCTVATIPEEAGLASEDALPEGKISASGLRAGYALRKAMLRCP